MKQLQLILPILILTLFISCKGKEKESFDLYPGSVTFDIESVEHIHLTNGRHIELDPLMDLRNLYVYDTLLLAKGPSTVNDLGLHIYNPNDGRLVRSLVKVGRGPDELLSVSAVQLLPQRGEMYLYEPNTRVGVVYKLDSLLKQNIIPSERFSFNDPLMIMDFRLDSSHYLYTPLYQRNISEGTTFMLGLYQLESSSVLARVSYPPLEDIDSVLNRGHIPSIFSFPRFDNMAYDEDSERLVRVYRTTDLIEIFDKELNRLVRVHGPDRFFPSFMFTRQTTFAEDRDPDFVRQTWPVARDVADVVVWSDDQRTAYVAPLAFPDGFYVLYSGEVTTNARETGFNFSLLFFNYEGTPQYRFTFEKGIRGIYTVDHKRGIAYMVDADYEIYAYDIRR